MDVDDWPLTGDCGDVTRALKRNVQPSLAQVLRGIGAAFKRSVTVGQINPHPRPNALASGGQVYPMGPRPGISTGKTWPMLGNEAAFREQLRDGLADMPFWGGTP